MSTRTKTTKTELQARLAQAEATIARMRAADTTPLRTPRDVAALAVDLLATRAADEQESFFAIALDARQRVLKVCEVARGSLSHVDVHPRELFRDAVRICAHSVILAHNHPSGDPSPSEADLDLTARMVRAGKLLGIPVLDHVIVTPSGRSASLASLGLMEAGQ